MAVSMVGALLLSAAAAQEALSEIEVGELGATDLLGRKADLGVDTNSFEYTQVPDLGGRTWDGYRDPLNEKLIEICEEKDPSLPQENMLKAVIADGASPSYQGEYNYTGLMWTAVRGKTELARILLDAGADTETINAWGRNAMFIAAWEGRTEIVREMIAAGANVSAHANHDLWNSLHKAAEMNNVEMVRMLLEAGADPTRRTLPDDTFPKGTTALALTKNKDCKRLLKAAIKEWKARRAAEALPAGEADTALAAEESIAAPEEAAAASEGSSKDEL